MAAWQQSGNTCVHNACPVCPSVCVCHSVETHRPLRTPGPAALCSCPASDPENQKTKKPGNQYAERLLTGRSQQSLPGNSLVFWFSGFLFFCFFGFGFPWSAQSPRPRCQMAAEWKHVCAQQVPCVPRAWVCHGVETQRPLRTAGTAVLSSCPASNPENQKTEKPDSLLVGHSNRFLETAWNLCGKAKGWGHSGHLLCTHVFPLCCHVAMGTWAWSRPREPETKTPKKQNTTNHAGSRKRLL